MKRASLFACGLIVATSVSTIQAAPLSQEELGEKFAQFLQARDTGDPEEGIRLGKDLLARLAEAFPNPEEPHRWAMGRVAFETALLQRRMQLFADARDTYKQAQSQFRELPGADAREAEARAEYQIGYMHTRQSDYKLARTHLQKSLEILDRAGKATSVDAGIAHFEFAEPFEFQGDFKTAEQHYKSALKIFTDLGRPTVYLSRVCNRLARMYTKQNRYAEAEQVCELNKENLESLPKEIQNEVQQLVRDMDRSREVALLYNARGILFWEQGDEKLRAAQQQFIAAIDASDEIRPYPIDAVAWYRMHLAELAAALGNLSDAEQKFQEVLTTATRNEEKAASPETAAMRIRLAALYARQKKWAEATQQMDQARKSLRMHVAQTIATLSEPEQIAFFQVKDKLWLHAGLTLALRMHEDGKIHQPLINASAEWVLNGKGLILPTISERLIAARESDSPANKAFEQLLAHRRKASEQSFRVGAEPSELSALLENERDLNRALARSTPSPDVKNTPWVTIQQVQRGLQRLDSAALIEIVRVDVLDLHKSRPEWARIPGRERYVAWVIPATGSVRMVPLGLANEVEVAVEDYLRTQLDQVNSENSVGLISGRDTIRGCLATVGRLVWEPLRGSVAKTKRLVVSPDSLLWQFPWPALPDGNKLLVEEHTLQFVHSGRELTIPDAPAPIREPGPAVIVAGVNYQERPTTPASKIQFVDPQLKFSLAEGREVEKSLAAWTGEPVVFLTSDGATERAFLEQANRPRVIHLSTHGFFKPTELSGFEDPLYRCALAFAGANQRGSKKNPIGEDGLLFGVEILGMDLRDTEVVVLSACESAVGEVTQAGKAANKLYSDSISEGVQGLHYAFRMAGARSVLGTLWEVSDRETAFLIAGFFKELAAGKSKAEALRTSQLARIQKLRDTKGGFAHPFYWAGLTISGN